MIKLNEEFPKTEEDKPSIEALPRTFSDSIAFGPTKKLLSLFVFRLAKAALTRCKRSKTKAPVMGILEVYILTVVGLEALINEICLDKIDQRIKWKKSASDLKELLEEKKGHYHDIKTKYDQLPQILWKNKFNKGGRIWCDFDALIKLRNDIVHYTPKWEEPSYIPEYLRSIYLRVSPKFGQPTEKVSKLESLLDGNQPFIDRICNIDMGIWAFDTGISMIRELLSLWPPKDEARDDYLIMFDRVGIKLPGLR